MSQDAGRTCSSSFRTSAYLRALGVAALTLTLASCAGSSRPRSAAATSSATSSIASTATSTGGTGSTTGSTATSTGSTGSIGSTATHAGPGPTGNVKVPQFDHIVLVIEENHAYDQVVGSLQSPYLNGLAAQGAVLSRSYAITHPSEPNYLALFSGSTQGLTDDSCPHEYAGPNLAEALISAGRSFVGYSEDQPAAGFVKCSSGAYVRKHNPWANFPALPSSVNQPMDAFPKAFGSLPSVCIVVPNLDHDMHDGSVSQGDSWLRTHLAAYAAWAATHNSLLIVTADEDDRNSGNRIPTMFVGARVQPGTYSTRTDHYGILRTILDAFQLQPFAQAAQAVPITGIWGP